jgi:hypothetical protein
MPLRLTANERGVDFVVRKGVVDYRVYPISDAGLRWLKSHFPHALWNRINGREAVTASYPDVARLLEGMRQNDFRVCGGLNN